MIGDGEGDDFFHPDVMYSDPTDRPIETFKSDNFDGVFYLADTYRIYHGFAKDVHALFYLEIPIVAIIDWEIYNGVKRGNLPVSPATATRPDTTRGVSKVWIKDTLLLASKKTSVPISVMVTPTVLSPFQLTRRIRKDAESYLPQKLFEILEGFKTGNLVKVNKGDLRVVYDIIHNTDVAQGALDIFFKGLKGFFMLSSNKFHTLEALLEIFYGRLVQSVPIKFEDTGIIVNKRRRSIENYDTTIDMITLWSEAVYSTWFPLDEIFDDIIQVHLNVNKDYEISQRVIVHLL